MSIFFVCHSQTIQFDNYTTKNGLLSDEVYKLFQDRKGYLWLFTNYGAMKYNGKSFTKVLNNLPFKESFIYSYFENDKGEIWVANSNANIYYVRNDSAFAVKGTERMSAKLKEDVSEIIDLFVDRDYNIFVNTKRGAFKLKKSQNYIPSDLVNYTNTDSLFVTIFYIDNTILSSINNSNRTKINKLSNDNHGYFYLNYLDKLKSSSIVKIKGSNLSKNPIYFKQFNDNVYFSFYNQIIKINKNKDVSYLTLSSFILNYLIDENGHLWAGTLNDGLFEIDNNDSIINHYLINRTINHVFIDSQNGLWASSDGGGIFHCKNLDEKRFTDIKNQERNLILLKKIDDKVFLTNASGGIFILDKGKLQTIKSSDEVNTDVLDVIKYHKGYVFCYRFNMEYIELDNLAIKILKLPRIKPAFYPQKICSVVGDSILCLGRKSILFLKRGISSLTSLNNIITLKHKIYTCEYRDGKFLFGTDNGVFILQNDSLVQPAFLSITGNCKITNILKDNFDNYWFCSKGYGLFKLNTKNELIHYTEKDELPSNVINDVYFNTDNSILLSTNKGLFHSSKYKKWIEIYKEQVKMAFGLKNDIYFTTKDGLVIHENSRQVIEPTIYFNLASVFVNSNLVSSKCISTLKHNQNNIEFNFDAISFSSNVPNILYQLNGPITQMGIAKNQQVIFQNLKPGAYTLTVSFVASNLKSHSVIIPFVINPAFWQTLWFKLFAILICLAFCYFIGFKIFKYYRLKENKKNEANRLITEYKLIALKAQINPHFISNCLSAIQHLIISNRLDEANQYLAKFSLLVRQVLNFSSKSFVTLFEELEITKLNIELEKLRFENNFDFVMELDNKIDLKSIYVPPLIFQPIVENAIWHGLLPLKQKRPAVLVIKIQELNEILTIVIEDNGVGRKIIDKNIGNIQESKGTKIVKQRIENLNILLGNNFGNLIFEDLKDSFGNPNGLQVKILLPIITFTDINNEN